MLELANPFSVGPLSKRRTRRRRLELHRTVVHAAEPKHGEVLHVVLVYAPGRFRSLLREGVERAQHVAGIEVDGGLPLELGVVHEWVHCA
jgi:hypothetical protein